MRVNHCNSVIEEQNHIFWGVDFVKKMQESLELSFFVQYVL